MVPFTMLEKTLQTKVTPLFTPGSAAYTVYNAASYVVASLALNYIVCPFQALSFDASITVWASLYYAGHIVVVVGILLLSFLPTPRAEGGSKGKPAPAAVAAAAPAPASASSEEPAPPSSGRKATRRA
jgi:hypothetical protein